ncbi:hypothetical protein SAMN06264364_1045 [Quadrisphaera granulorum]|uniref:Uncharacterized protein n=1 Tax=Quadrisphaera granulorum TaxID=317664 RepID=A0A316ADX7_9ACTN|nr:hypothetical protein [Quadrisphaera granulorum]PWJ55084.1 hypothetical protein BXY45_1045 [Quadrisphaera granulorum]SZE95593.1 hypothetical protein SAMN06264364_1045 [Quadrisphaera granulorum]
MVGIPSVGADTSDCSALADTYTDAALAGFRQLELEQRQTPEGLVCVVKLRSKNVLTGSIRRLGDELPPVSTRA